MNEDRHKAEVQFLIETLTTEVAKIIIEEQGMSIQEALDLIYRSHTFEKVEKENTGLYYQGAVYILDMLKEEFGPDLQPDRYLVAEVDID